MDGPEGIVRDESRSGGPQHRDRQLGHRPLFLEQTKLITLLSAFVSTSSFSLRSTIEVSTQMTIYYEELPDSITREFEQYNNMIHTEYILYKDILCSENTARKREDGR
jgi:hypothetical protein